VCDGRGRPLRLDLTEGQRSDHKGAEALIATLPPAKTLLADRAYDSRWFRQALSERGITPCIPPQRNRKIQSPYDPALYRQRHRIENTFARLKDWRRTQTRYDRCADTFTAAITIAAILIFWINEA
jgi:putative transposase